MKKKWYIRYDTGGPSLTVIYKVGKSSKGTFRQLIIIGRSALADDFQSYFSFLSIRPLKFMTRFVIREE